MKEMEKLFQSQAKARKEQATQTEEPTQEQETTKIIARRLDNYQSTNALFDTAFLFERAEDREQIIELCSHYAFERGDVEGFPAIITASNIAPHFEEAIQTASRGTASTPEPTALAMEESPSTEAPEVLPMVVVSEGYQRLDNYQPQDEDDATFTVAFVLPNEEMVETIHQACLQYLVPTAWKGGIEIEGFPVLLTTVEYASQIEEALITARGSVEPTQAEDTGAVEIWTLPDHTAEPQQTSLFADMPPVEKKTRAKKSSKKQQPGPQQQSLFDI